jgi:hypothetical protein
MKILEKQVEAYLCKRIKELGGICEKFTSPQKRSVPDRIVTLTEGRIFFVEVKAPTGKLTEKQQLDHNVRVKLGCSVLTVYSHDDVDNAFPKSLR